LDKLPIRGQSEEAQERFWCANGFSSVSDIGSAKVEGNCIAPVFF